MTNTEQRKLRDTVSELDRRSRLLLGVTFFGEDEILEMQEVGAEMTEILVELRGILGKAAEGVDRARDEELEDSPP